MAVKLPITWYGGERAPDGTVVIAEDKITYGDLQQITVKEFARWKRQLESTPRRAFTAGDPAVLRKAKKDAKLTISQIAKALGVTQRMVYKMLAGDPTEKAGALRELLGLLQPTPKQNVSPHDPLK